jgi:hypothetical protein
VVIPQENPNNKKPSEKPTKNTVILSKDHKQAVNKTASKFDKEVSLLVAGTTEWNNK